jgi:hypothetical protein
MKVDEVRLPHRPTESDHNNSFVLPWTLGIIGTLTGLAFVLIALTLNRGFDWSDEGFSYTLLTNNRVGDGEVWGFQYLLHPLFNSLGESIVAFRVLRLLGYVGISILLCWIARLTLNDFGLSLRRSSWIIVLLVAQVGTFSAWSYPPRNLGYNELASWLSQAAGALLLFLLITSRATSKPRQRFPRVAIWGTVGALIAIVFLAKFTVAVLLLIFATVVVFFLPTLRVRLLSAGALVGGIIATILILLIARVPIIDYSLNIFTAMQDSSTQTSSGYSPTTLLSTYLQSASVTIAAIALPTILIAVGLLVSRGWRGERSSRPTPLIVMAEHVAFALIALLGLLMVFPRSESSWTALGIANTLLLCVALIGFAVLARFTPQQLAPKSGVTVVLALALFALTPLVSGIGTNNAIFGQTVFSATIWAVGAAIVLNLLAERTLALSSLARAIPLLLLSFITLSGTIAVAADVFQHPYRTAPYFEQTTEVPAGALHGLSLKPQEAAVAVWLHEAGSRHDAAGMPAISMTSPGALLAFNASPWTNAWPGPDWATSITRSCTLEYPDGLFVLQSGEDRLGTENYDKLVAGLAACDITFPQDFTKVDQRADNSPGYKISIWRLSDNAEPSR